MTAKGGLLENGYFDLRAVYPNLILAFFLIAGMIRGLVIPGCSSTTDTAGLPGAAAQLDLGDFLSLLAGDGGAWRSGANARQVRSRAPASRRPAGGDLPARTGVSLTGQTRDLSARRRRLIVIDRPRATSRRRALIQIEFTLGVEPLLPVPAAACCDWEERRACR